MNSYDNLILLCATHHKVVDDDEQAYTVARLQTMKADHEARATPISDTEADQVAISYSTFSNVGQSGGVAVNSIVGNNVTFNAGQPSEVVLKRQMEALENLWRMTLAMREEFGSIISLDNILRADEIDECFRTGRKSNIIDSVYEYANFESIDRKMRSINPDKERPYVSERIWFVIFILRAIYGRSAFLIHSSILDKRYHDWRTDSGIDQLLSTALRAVLVDSIKQKPIGGLWAAIQYLESDFLTEARLQKAH